MTPAELSHDIPVSRLIKFDCTRILLIYLGERWNVFYRLSFFWKFLTLEKIYKNNRLLSLKNSLRRRTRIERNDWSRLTGCQGHKRHFGSEIRSLRLYVSCIRESVIVFYFS